MARDAGTELSKGGMKTKIEAAKIATAAGTHMVIASGKVHHPLQAIADGAPCTWFIAPSDPMTARKRWIAGQLEPKREGLVVVVRVAQISEHLVQVMRHARQGGAAFEQHVRVAVHSGAVAWTRRGCLSS